jgi:hypothetical protein
MQFSFVEHDASRKQAPPTKRALACAARRQLADGVQIASVLHALGLVAGLLAAWAVICAT